MTNETTLLPCPFCGGEAHVIVSSDGYGIECWGELCTKNQLEEIPTEAEAIAAWNTRAATTIGKAQVEIEPVLRGMLTAEQVRELMEEHSRDYPSPTDPYVYITKYDWQAIADELNAELGSGTCCLHYGEDDDGYDGWYCDECGGWFQAVWRDGHLVEPKHCPHCGRRVKR